MALATVLSVAVRKIKQTRRLTDPRWSPCFPSVWSKGLEKEKKTVRPNSFTAWASDKLGSRKIPFVSGSILSIIGTVLFCLARAPGVLLCARILQGFANGVVYSVGLPLIAETVSPSEIGYWLAILAAIGSVTLPLLTG
ncbi:MAG: hypothetical protein L6R40_002016 [Gallowayella cf. fulva]|nr:MAG: hypothetical protein L6R40_002016 [Xanthomendoza cf. fulva]